jgi:hypothetical protein
MIRACGADDVALALPRQKFRKRRFQMIDDKPCAIFEQDRIEYAGFAKLQCFH